MSSRERLFVAEKGLSIDGAVDFLYGSTIPGNTQTTDEAGVGSLYSETNSGAIWKKIFGGSGSDKLQELISNELPITVGGITASTVLDQIPTTESNYFVWSVSAWTYRPCWFRWSWRRSIRQSSF